MRNSAVSHSIVRTWELSGVFSENVLCESLQPASMLCLGTGDILEFAVDPVIHFAYLTDKQVISDLSPEQVDLSR